MRLLASLLGSLRGWFARASMREVGAGSPVVDDGCVPDFAGSLQARQPKDDTAGKGPNKGASDARPAPDQASMLIARSTAEFNKLRDQVWTPGVREKRIAVVGAALSGKSSLFREIRKLHTPMVVRVYPTEWDRYCQYSFRRRENVYSFRMTPGSLYWRDKCIRFSLSKADIVLYLVTTQTSECCLDEDELVAGYFADLHKAASALKKTWNDVPWFLVINQVEWRGMNEWLHHLPPEVRESPLRMSVKNPVDIERLLDAIDKKLDQREAHASPSI